MNNKVLYRVERLRCDEHGLQARITLETFEVVRETPKGCYISVYGEEKFVRNDAKKRYAYPTVEEAMANFRARTARCITILRAQLRQAEAYLGAIDKPDTLQSLVSEIEESNLSL